MALDISIVDAEERPIESVAVDPQLHVRLMAVARHMDLPLLLRFADYYGEASIELTELPAFMHEAEGVLRELVADPPLTEIAADLVALAKRAAGMRARILGIPD